ncbi:glycosyltransferase family 4 protein [Candidatus Nomurabacteria bacterium]|nr:glycosyltransferase family 4 protein [Candidatus Nomurabacteria bacterium]
MSKHKFKVVIFSAFYDPFMSGAEQMVKEILERIGEKYSMTLVTARIRRDLPKREQRDGYDIIRVGTGTKIDKFLYPLLAPFAARRLQPRIVHAILESYAGIALYFLKFVYPRAKRILTLQSGGLDHEDKQKEFFLKLFWRKMHSTPHKVTAISRFLAQRGQKFRAETVDLTPNGLDFSHVPKGVPQKEGRVICVGRLSWVKGHKYLLEAWPLVLKEVPGARLVLVGDGDERKNIEKQTRELSIQDSVKLLGNLPHDEVLREMSQSEVFVCPSLAEGLGIVFIEAQACGIPVIGTNVGGIPDIIEDNQTGYLIETKNPDQIAEKLIVLLKDKELRKRFVESSQHTVKKFEWNTIIAKIDEIYTSL